MNGRYLYLPPVPVHEACDVCGDPGRPVTEDGYPLTPITDGAVLCDSDDESHASVRETYGPRTETAR